MSRKVPCPVSGCVRSWIPGTPLDEPNVAAHVAMPHFRCCCGGYTGTHPARHQRSTSLPGPHIWEPVELPADVMADPWPVQAYDPGMVAPYVSSVPPLGSTMDHPHETVRARLRRWLSV